MAKTKVLILGAGGAIAQQAIPLLEKDDHVALTLFARNKKKIPHVPASATVIEGDVLKHQDLDKAVKGQNIVYANLAGPMEKLAKAIIQAMEAHGVKRLIFITSLGIYHEIPGKFGAWNEKMIGEDLVRYRQAADAIEASSLDYTLVRPSWLTDKNETDYETTRKGEPFTGTEVARKAVAAYITDIIKHPEKDVRASVGVNKPGVYGDKPSFY
ncbi:SDR family oxidoreductase [Chitinophaga varians]|uniref:SDR family oxidoreductase n=1 Tax=Chitinophaga varians TaxID=2202339 RepID=UPI00165FE022|nr:SDR family oxidoreductase [Chitinophaga varians]MBC9914260.1 SDR family oxidoreductase [Chitinophaga varians]